MLRGLSLCIDHAELLEKLPHAIVDFETKFFTDVNVILKARCQISKHRIDASRQSHQVAGVGRHDLIDAPSKIIETNVHVQRGADVQTNHQSVQLAHHDVFQTASHQLIAGAKDFRADEAGNVVENDPRILIFPTTRESCRDCLSERSGKAVLARFVNDHIDAMTVAIGKVSSLTCFKVQAESPVSCGCCMLHHLID